MGQSLRRLTSELELDWEPANEVTSFQIADVEEVSSYPPLIHNRFQQPTFDLHHSRTTNSFLTSPTCPPRSP